MISFTHIYLTGISFTSSHCSLYVYAFAIEKLFNNSPPIATLMSDHNQSAAVFAIAKLVPVGPDAEKAFDDVVAFPDLSEHHRSCIRAERSKKRDTSPEFSSEDTDAEESPPMSEKVVELWTGHFSLDTSKFKHLENPRAQWRVGKGTSRFRNADREVDILLIRPGRKSDDVSKSNALISLHEKSGVLMLVGLSDTQPITYESGIGGVAITLRSGEKHVLYQRENRFSFGKLRFKLVYEDFDDARLAAVTQNRDRFFSENGIPRPHPCFSMIPRAGHVLRGSAVIHTTFALGGFGHVHAAVDTRTGEPLAIKDMWINDERRAKDPELIAELTISEAFKVSSTYLRILL